MRTPPIGSASCFVSFNFLVEGKNRSSEQHSCDEALQFLETIKKEQETSHTRFSRIMIEYSIPRDTPRTSKIFIKEWIALHPFEEFKRVLECTSENRSCEDVAECVTRISPLFRVLRVQAIKDPWEHLEGD